MNQFVCSVDCEKCPDELKSQCDELLEKTKLANECVKSETAYQEDQQKCKACGSRPMCGYADRILPDPKRRLKDVF